MAVHAPWGGARAPARAATRRKFTISLSLLASSRAPRVDGSPRTPPRLERCWDGYSGFHDYLPPAVFDCQLGALFSPAAALHPALRHHRASRLLQNGRFHPIGQLAAVAAGAQDKDLEGAMLCRPLLQ
eukprot:COSAG02_NODE_893_length_16140_cov_19.677621_4_plen_128_part_00